MRVDRVVELEQARVVAHRVEFRDLGQAWTLRAEQVLRYSGWRLGAFGILGGCGPSALRQLVDQQDGRSVERFDPKASRHARAGEEDRRTGGDPQLARTPGEKPRHGMASNPDIVRAAHGRLGRRGRGEGHRAPHSPDYFKAFRAAS